MKRNLSIIAILVTGLTSSLAMAIDTANLAVSATVAGKCKFATVGGLTFGTSSSPGVSIDPSDAGNATGTASVTYRCTSGTAATSLGMNNGANFSGTRRVAVAPAGPFMGYSLVSAGFTQTGAGFGGAVLTATVTGTIPEATHQVAAAGVYTDTVSITINP